MEIDTLLATWTPPLTSPCFFLFFLNHELLLNKQKQCKQLTGDSSKYSTNKKSIQPIKNKHFARYRTLQGMNNPIKPPRNKTKKHRFGRMPFSYCLGHFSHHVFAESNILSTFL